MRPVEPTNTSLTEYRTSITINDLNQLNQELFARARLIGKQPGDKLGSDRVFITVVLSGRSTGGAGQPDPLDGLALLSGEATVPAMSLPASGSSAPEDWKLLAQAQEYIMVGCSSKKTEECNFIPLAHIPRIASYDSFKLDITFHSEHSQQFQNIASIEYELSFDNPRHTLMVIYMRFTMVLCGIVALTAALYWMRHFPWSEWTFDQHWLIGLGFVLAFVSNLFFALLLVYWPSSMHYQASGPSSSNIIGINADLLASGSVDGGWRVWLKFYSLKAVYALFIFFFSLSIDLWHRYHLGSNPTLHFHAAPFYIALIQVLLMLCLAFYVFFFGFFATRAYRSNRGQENGKRQNFILLVSTCFFLVVFAAYIVSIFEIEMAGWGFSFLVFFNFTLLMLIFIHMPTRTAAINQANRRLYTRPLVNADDRSLYGTI
ncbi:hypothetical protein H696_05916 [Fonticula alba]|uniref:Wntless-like transmembrane domain-containing protein n=1 Tax=Fonticula alba TaxID=691883 RepID=A0A058Z039_FONAL|nr:hypothetical protein H696_05916 [Fonticula alba]KCV67629.1 hypothetical protein H696_05916 [Fonticula alba]|eukprot:XP_009497967.1 hypothetical protein H696_05916 [Fonticula alba]